MNPSTRCFRCSNPLPDHFTPCPICEGRKNAKRIEDSNRSALDGMRQEAERDRAQRQSEAYEERREQQRAADEIRRNAQLSVLKPLIRRWMTENGEDWFMSHYMAISLGIGSCLGRDAGEWRSFCSKIASKALDPDNKLLLSSYEEMISSYLEVDGLRAKWRWEAISRQKEKAETHDTQCKLALACGFAIAMAVAWHFMSGWYTIFKIAAEGFLLLWAIFTFTGMGNAFTASWPDLGEDDQRVLKKKDEDDLGALQIMDLPKSQGRTFFEALFSNDPEGIVDVLADWEAKTYVVSSVLHEELDAVQDMAARWRPWFQQNWALAN